MIKSSFVVNIFLLANHARSDRSWNTAITDLVAANPGYFDGGDISRLNNYGCWCVFGSSTKGNSAPLDDLDRSCRDLTYAFRCASMEICKSADVDTFYYLVHLTIEDLELWNKKSILGSGDLTTINLDIATKCGAANGGESCAVNLCIIQATFLTRLYQAFSTPFTNWIREGYVHGETFSHEQSCPEHKSTTNVGTSGTGGGAGQPEAYECCGVWPQRFPYLPSVKECCRDVNVFNPLTHECCLDGSSESIGSCNN